MSLKTWKKEFYPKNAKTVSAKNSIAHSLRKWQGLTKTNLKKHDLHKQPYNMIGDGDFYMEIDSDSCALCKQYENEDDYEYENKCNDCPLYQFLGQQCDEESTSPYAVWIDKGNAVPMINSLKQTLKRSKNENLHTNTEIF